MERTPTLVEVHYALWAVLAVPTGFAGAFFLIGLLLLKAGILLAISGLCLAYVANLSRGSRLAWLAGVVGHTALLLGAAYYLPRWPGLLTWPLALLNLFSLGVLLGYRRLWSPTARSAAPDAQPA